MGGVGERGTFCFPKGLQMALHSNFTVGGTLALNYDLAILLMEIYSQNMPSLQTRPNHFFLWLSAAAKEKRRCGHSQASQMWE